MWCRWSSFVHSPHKLFGMSLILACGMIPVAVAAPRAAAPSPQCRLILTWGAFILVRPRTQSGFILLAEKGTFVDANIVRLLSFSMAVSLSIFVIVYTAQERPLYCTCFGKIYNYIDNLLPNRMNFHLRAFLDTHSTYPGSTMQSYLQKTTS